MNSEIAKLSDATPDWPRAWVLYDGDCSLCRKWVARSERTLTVRGFDLAPLQSAWVTECLDLPEHELLSRMRVLTRDGRDYAGADALIYLARHVWWAWPFQPMPTSLERDVVIVERVRLHFTDLELLESGIGQHRRRQLLPPHAAKARAATRERHCHAMHRRDGV